MFRCQGSCLVPAEVQLAVNTPGALVASVIRMICLDHGEEPPVRDLTLCRRPVQPLVVSRRRYPQNPTDHPDPEPSRILLLKGGDQSESTSGRTFSFAKSAAARFRISTSRSSRRFSRRSRASSARSPVVPPVLSPPSVPACFPPFITDAGEHPHP